MKCKLWSSCTYGTTIVARRSGNSSCTYGTPIICRNKRTAVMGHVLMIITFIFFSDCSLPIEPLLFSSCTLSRSASPINMNDKMAPESVVRSMILTFNNIMPERIRNDYWLCLLIFHLWQIYIDCKHYMFMCTTNIKSSLLHMTPRPKQDTHTSITDPVARWHWSHAPTHRSSPSAASSSGLLALQLSI